jgi:lysophospholipase L1-like esterase
MRQSIFGYGILFRALGLVTVLFTLVTCTPAVAPSPVRAGTPKPGEALHLAIFGDGLSRSYGEYYAKQIETDLGVKVEFDNLSMPWLSSGQVLNDLRDGPASRFGVQRAVKQANVVIFYATPTDYIGDRIYILGAGSEKYDCSAKALASYKADLEAIIAEIFSLRKGQPTIIRAMNSYNPVSSEWKKRGMYDEYKRCWDALNATIHQAATEHKIPVADVYAAFNGPNHDQDPRDQGYLGADGVHTNEAGDKVIVDTLRKLGYEYIVP